MHLCLETANTPQRRGERGKVYKRIRLFSRMVLAAKDNEPPVNQVPSARDV